MHTPRKRRRAAVGATAAADAGAARATLARLPGALVGLAFSMLPQGAHALLMAGCRALHSAGLRPASSPACVRWVRPGPGVAAAARLAPAVLRFLEPNGSERPHSATDGAGLARLCSTPQTRASLRQLELTAAYVGMFVERGWLAQFRHLHTVHVDCGASQRVLYALPRSVARVKFTALSLRLLEHLPAHVTRFEGRVYPDERPAHRSCSRAPCCRAAGPTCAGSSSAAPSA